MSSNTLNLNLTNIFNSLSEIPLTVRNKSEALKRITVLGRQALNSHVCTLSVVDLQTETLTTVACDCDSKEFEEFVVGRIIEMGSYERGDHIDYELMAKGVGGERYGLQIDGQGMANPETARKYGLSSVLSCPLKSENGLILYFNHFSNTSDKFTQEEKRLIQIFSRLALLTMERVDNLHLQEHALQIFNELSQSLLSVSLDDFLEHVSVKAAELLFVPICIVWKLDKPEGELKIVATHGDVDEDYKKKKLGLDDPGIKKHLESHKVGYLFDASIPNAMFRDNKAVKKRGWVSLLTAPMWAENNLIGMLDIFTVRPREFQKWEKEIFYLFAKHAALAIQKADLLRESQMLAELQKLKEHDQIVADIRESVDKVTSGDNITVEGELEKISDLIVKKCADATAATTSFLWLWNKVTSSLELKASYKEHETDNSDKACNLEFVECVARTVVEKGEANTYEALSTGQQAAQLTFNARPCSFLCVPIRSGDIVIGAIGIGKDKLGVFEENEQMLLERIADEVSISLERAHLADNLLSLAEAPIQSESVDDLLVQLVRFTRGLMREPICLAWLIDKDRNGFAATAIAAPEDHKLVKSSFFIRNSPDLDEFFKRTQPLYFKDASVQESHPYVNQVKALGWKSMLAMPLIYHDRSKDRRIGILEVYSYKEERNFTDWHRKLFKTLAVQASIAIVSRTRRKRNEELNQILQKMQNQLNIDKLLKSALKDALTLAGSSRGWISRLDPSTGLLNMKIREGKPQRVEPLKVGEGITGKALEEERPILVDNISDEQWEGIYKVFWRDTKAELAVPLLIKNARVRIGHKPIPMSKLIGVLNIESPTLSAFSDAHQSNLMVLAQQAALVIDRLELDAKLNKLSKVQKQLAGKRDWDEILKIIPRAIEDILGYEYVNISMVDRDRKSIRTVYVRGIKESEVEEFKRMAHYPLEDESPQSDVVRTKKIEVSDENNGRSEQNIWEQFGHKDLIRVFVPMMAPPGNRVIGTVEAGYKRGYRKYMYEQDIQILKNLLDFAVLSLEPRTRGLLEIISHEFSNTVVGLRNNVSLLKERINQLDESFINIKFEDMMLDCEVLSLQVEALEHTFGRAFAVSKKEETIVFRDVVVKTIKQLKPIFRIKKLDCDSKIDYSLSDIHRIVLYVDKAKLSQVVYNILTNSIKYAESDKSQFKIAVSVEETSDNFIIKFQDWGIGVKEGLEEAIFEEGFRAPEAINKAVEGLGLGLSIVRKTMKDMGGDLILFHNRKPTEFHLLLPKSLKED